MKGEKITTIKFENPVKVTGIDSDGIKFSDGTVITDYHGQDCCETVYADWTALETTGFPAETFTKLTLKGIPDGGIGLNEYFVPCYNQQNGWYSSDLEIQITQGRVKSVLDISEYVEDQID